MLGYLLRVLKMQYKAVVSTDSTTVTGNGHSDHAAIQNAVAQLPNAWLTPNATIRLYHIYANGDFLSSLMTLSKYLDMTS